MAFVGLIPARGGSKGIPGKNIAPCAGRPLIAWTCEAATRSVKLERTVLSTDSDDIAQVGRTWGVDVPFARPAELALDDTPSFDVMLHALDWLERDGVSVAGLVLLQPTSPLRTHAHIDQAIDEFAKSGADTLVSVVEVPHRFHPDSVMREANGWLRPYHDGKETVTRRQALAPLFGRNGPAILIVSPRVLRSGGLYGERVRPYLMSAADSVDVDAPLDLEYADFVLRRRSSASGD